MSVLKNDSFESMLVSYKKYLQSDENEGEQNENKKCTIKLEIAKKYNDYDKMMEDNMQTIYFDENYDNTFYPILEIYNQEKQKLTPSQFEIFLSSKLKEVNNLSDDETKYMVETLLNNKKKVIDGQYALLETLNEDEDNVELKLFQRVNNKWVMDQEATKTHENNFSLSLNPTLCDNDLLCDVNLDQDNIKTDCVSNNDKQRKSSK